MRKSKFSEEQIRIALGRHVTGDKAGAICADLGVSQQTFYNWKNKFGGVFLRKRKEKQYFAQGIGLDIAPSSVTFFAH